MKRIEICSGCSKSLAKTPLIEIIISYEVNENEIIEQEWHRSCYQGTAELEAENERLRAALQAALPILETEYWATAGLGNEWEAKVSAIYNTVFDVMERLGSRATAEENEG